MLYRPGLLGRMPCPMNWYADVGPPTIDDPFVGVLPGGWVFTRGSANATNCLYTDSPTAPPFTTYTTNAPRFLEFGLLMEPQSTNLFLYSDTPGSQTIPLAVGSYTLWCVGPAGCTAYVTKTTAAITPNPATATLGVPVTFQVTTAGNVVASLTGSPTRVQLEKGTSPTSYISTPAAVAQTRQEDRLYKNYLAGQLNANEGTYWIEYVWAGGNKYVDGATPAKAMTAGIGSYTSDANSDQIRLSAFGATNTVSGQTYDSSNALVGNTSVNAASIAGKVSRAAYSVSSTKAICAVDYTIDVPNATYSANRPAVLAITLGGGGLAPMSFNGFIRGFRYWPVAMSDPELRECTEAGYYQCPPVFNLDGTQPSQWRRWTYSRTASATGIATDALFSDPAGTVWSQYGSGLAPPGTPRWTTRGLLLDSTRSNYVPTPDAVPASGVVGALGLQSYMLSVRGTGNITLTPGTCAGTGFPAVATQGNPAVVNITTSGNANFVRTGTIEIAQLEQVGTPNAAIGQDQGPTTFIRTTSINQSRQSDGISVDIGPWWNQSQGTYVIEMVMLSRIAGTFIWGIDDGTNNNREQLFATFGNTGLLTWGSNTVYRGFNPGRIDPDVSQQPMPINTVLKIAVSVSSDRKRQLAMNGVLGGTGNLNQSGDDGQPGRPVGVTKMKIGMNNTGPIPSAMFVRRWRYYDYAMFDDQLVALTT